MGKMDGHKDEDSGAATVPNSGWKGGVGNVFGNRGARIWDWLKGEGQRPVADCKSRRSLNSEAHRVMKRIDGNGHKMQCCKHLYNN